MRSILGAFAATILVAHSTWADAKVILECVGQSQHRCLGKFGCMMGGPDCRECEAGDTCKGANTCFASERFTVVIDGDKDEVSTFKYKVETANDSYSFTPADPNTFGQWHKDDRLSINRIAGGYMWWPADLVKGFRPGWYYDEGDPTINPDLGCHEVKQRF